MRDLILLWPPKILNPNARPHFRALARAKKAYRQQCHWLAVAWDRPALPPEGLIQIELTFCPPDRRQRDDDNFEAAFKAGRDGLADAWGVDDHRFRVTKRVGGPTPNGAIIVRLLESGAA